MKQSNLITNLDKDLWEVYDAFRAEVMSSQGVKHYLFSMITLKYLSENNHHPYNIDNASNWLHITKHGVDIGERFDKAFKVLELENPTLREIWTLNKFAGINDKILFSVADSVLNKYSFAISELEDPHPVTGTMAQYIEKLLHFIIQKEGVSGGESSSPKELSELMVRLLNVTNGTLNDGAAGVNDFLIEGYKYALRTGGSVKIFGQEINQQTWSLGKMNLLLHGLHPDVAEVKKGHTIINPLWKSGDSLMKFDGVLSSPPFGIGNWGHQEALNDLYGRFRYGVPSKSTGDMAFVQHFIASLNNRGKAAIIVPHGVLFRGASEGKIREELIKEDIIEAVIGLPSNLFYGTGIPGVILLINKDKGVTLKNKVLIINAEEGFEKGRVKNTLRQADIDKITTTYLAFKEIEEYSKIIEISEIRNNDWNLSPYRYFEKVEVETDLGVVKINKRKYQDLDLIKLEAISELKRGVNVSKGEIGEDDPSQYLINLSDVDKDGSIMLDSLTGVSLSPSKAREYDLVPGDVLVSSRGTVLKVSVISETNIPLTFSHNFVRIRLHDQSKFSPSYIKVFLDSPIGHYYLKSLQRGSTVTVLSHKDLAKIPIPKIPFRQQVEVAETILKAEREYERVVQDALKSKESSYLKGYEIMGVSDSFNINKES
jgi:type I restriction enzyme M protein